MRIIVYAHSMEIGGSQLNAIEIGSAVQRQGHEVVLVGEDGPLAEKAMALGLEHFRIQNRRRRPSLPVMRKLLELVRCRKIEVVHGYEWPPAIESWLGPGLIGAAVPFATVMSAEVAPFLPHTLGLVVGTRQLQHRCLKRGFSDVTLIEPPVDVEENSPTFDGSEYRASLGLRRSTVLVVVVCRLVRELKLEGLIAATRAVGQLVKEGIDIRLLIVGDGPVRHEVELAVGEANALAGSEAVLIAGETRDPRPAYASADVVLGMGGSALRGMAFGKPLIVQGERGFWQLCDGRSVGVFLESGWYGLGDGGDGVSRLRGELLTLVQNPDLRRSLGTFSRDLVVSRFGLDGAARVQIECYERALVSPRRPSLTEITKTLSGLAAYKAGRRWQRMRGTIAGDDFNAIRHMSGGS
ncbi:MAG: glycosyltransferase [Burkholderiales bacterium]